MRRQKNDLVNAQLVTTSSKYSTTEKLSVFTGRQHSLLCRALYYSGDVCLHICPSVRFLTTYSLCEYSRWFPGRGRQTTVGLSRTTIFSVFAGCLFGTFRDKANIIIQRHGVPCRFFTDPRISDLIRPWTAILLTFCFTPVLVVWKFVAVEDNRMQTHDDRVMLSAVQIFTSDSSFWRYKVYSRVL